MTPERLQEILDRFPSRRIAVVGDFFLDKYLDLDPASISIRRSRKSASRPVNAPIRSSVFAAVREPPAPLLTTLHRLMQVEFTRSARSATTGRGMN
jgi:hypothetical protein